MTLLVAGALAAALFVVEALLDLKLQDLGEGILDFEVAGTTERAEEIVTGWGGERSTAQVQLWLDYPFLVAVAVFMAAAVLAVADGLAVGSRLRAAAAAAAWLPIAAGAADVVENTTLLLIVGGHTDQPLPGLALVAAVIKYACGFTAVGYVLGGLWLRRTAPAGRAG